MISLFLDLPHLHFFFYLQLCCPSYCEQSNTRDREGLGMRSTLLPALIMECCSTYLARKKLLWEEWEYCICIIKHRANNQLDHKQMEVPFLQSYIQNFQTIIQTLLIVLACVCISTQPKATNSCAWSTRSCIVQWLISSRCYSMIISGKVHPVDRNSLAKPPPWPTIHNCI